MNLALQLLLMRMGVPTVDVPTVPGFEAALTKDRTHYALSKDRTHWKVEEE